MRADAAHSEFSLCSARGLCPTKRERNTKSTNQSTKSTKNAEYEVLFVSALVRFSYWPIMKCKTKRTVRVYVTGLLSLCLPETNLMTVYDMKPKARPWATE